MKKTAQLQVKIDPQLKVEAALVAEEMGLTLSGVITAFLKQLVRDRAVTFTAQEDE